MVARFAVDAGAARNLEDTAVTDKLWFKGQNVAFEVTGDTARVELEYPRVNQVTSVEVDLLDVRPADGIRVSYDFDRDGWKIEQASTFSWEADDEVCDPDWQEVAFVQAWGRQDDRD